MALVLLFLYIPIFVLIVFSFNVTKSRSVFSGFTFDWYIKLFHNGLIMLSLIHISEPTRRTPISYAVFCLKKKKMK